MKLIIGNIFQTQIRARSEDLHREKKTREREPARSLTTTSTQMMMNIKVLSSSIYYLKPVLEQKMNIRRTVQCKKLKP
jgi:hypothetical protein